MYLDILNKIVSTGNISHHTQTYLHTQAHTYTSLRYINTLTQTYVTFVGKYKRFIDNSTSADER